MSDTSKSVLLQKTGEYMEYIHTHKKNVIRAWREIKQVLGDIPFLMRERILENMEYRVNTHDDSKFDEDEFLVYRQHFYPVPGEAATDGAFESAWQTHYRRNDHHWQYWVNEDGGYLSYANVDEKICAFLEMICDWQALGYVFGDDAPSYYQKHKHEIDIDDNWRSFIEEVLLIISDSSEEGA